MRMDRRAGLLGKAMPSLAELLADATRIGGGGKTGYATGTITVSLSGIDTSQAFYCFYMTGPEYEISKIVGTTKTVIAASGTRVVTVSSSSITTGTIQGGSIVLLRFPTYASVADSVLAQMAVAVKASVYSSNSANISMAQSAVASDKIYLVAFANSNADYTSFSVGSAITTQLFSYPDSRVYLFLSGSNYMATVNGYQAGTFRVGGIYELS